MYYKNLKSRDHIRLNLISKKNITNILIPELVCKEYIEEISKTNLKIIFYQLKKDLNPDEEKLTKLINGIDINKIIIIITDYFGISSLKRTFKICKQQGLKVYIDAAISLDAAYFAIENNLDYSFSLYKHVGSYKGIYASKIREKNNLKKEINSFKDLIIWTSKLLLIFRRRNLIFRPNVFFIAFREIINIKYYFLFFIKNYNYNFNSIHNIILTLEKFITSIYISMIINKLKLEKNLDFKQVFDYKSLIYGLPIWLREEELSKYESIIKIYAWPDKNNNKIKNSELRLYFIPTVP